MTAKKKITEKKPKQAEEKAENKKKQHSAATASAILGLSDSSAPNKQKKIKPEWRKYYEILLDLREQLVKQRNGLAKESAEIVPTYSLHMADSGTDNFDRDFALSLLSSDQDAIYEIDEAIKRIENGTYGICELTGKPIPKSRLDAIPWTRYTVEAQQQLEKEGLAKQKRLAQLGTIDLIVPMEEEEEQTEEGEDLKEK